MDMRDCGTYGNGDKRETKFRMLPMFKKGNFYLHCDCPYCSWKQWLLGWYVNEVRKSGVIQIHPMQILRAPRIGMCLDVRKKYIVTSVDEYVEFKNGYHAKH